ncbi:integrase, catalytic region, zinc finger, CCHC-type containing protein [Tanacetum coccineum]
MSTANQQTLAESGTEGRPPILEKGSYVPWASQFLRFLDNKREEGALMRNSIDNRPYNWKEKDDLNNAGKKCIPNDIYNSVDACEDAQGMWQCFAVEAGESLTSVYERFSTLVNNMDQNKHFDKLYDYLSQSEPHVNASRAKKAARNHDPLVLVANQYGNLSYYHARDAQEGKLSIAMMLLARSITQNYSTSTNNRLCTSSNTRNQAVIQDGHVDTQRKNVSYAGNGSRNAGRTTGNQETNAGNDFAQNTVENEENVQRIPRTTSTPGKTNIQCYNYNGKGHYARDCPKSRVRDAKYFREQMMLTAKDEAGVNLDTKENDFMLMNAYGDDQLKELNASVITMARIQPTNNKSDAEPTYDEVISEVNASQIDLINILLSKGDHEHRNHEKFETIKHTSDDNQINSDIIFDDPYMEDYSGQP